MPTGSRVYHLDRECYVIYMGKGDRQYRPFLRIGTSPFIPSDIRRHIGSVVLPDRMTGDYFQEADCLEQPITRNMHYVGSPELIKAVRHFIRKDEIALQPIQSVKDKPEETGAKVHFFKDGNLRVFMDGHRLFDLVEREKSDNHQVYQYRRLCELIESDTHAFTEADFEDPGFIPMDGPEVFGFANGIIEIHGTGGASAARLVSRLLPLTLVRRFGARANRDAMFSLVKWHHVENRSIEFVLEDLNTKTGPTSDLEADLLEMLDHIHAKAKAKPGLDLPAPAPAAFVKAAFGSRVDSQADGQTDAQATGKSGGAIFNRLDLQAGDPGGSTELFLAEGQTWHGGREPALFTGVPVHIGSAGDGLWKKAVSDSQESLSRLMGSQHLAAIEQFSGYDESAKQRHIGQLLSESEDPVGRLAALLWIWNDQYLHEVAGGSLFSSAQIGLMASLQDEQIFPLIGRLVDSGEGWVTVYRLTKDITRSELRQRQQIVEKIQKLLAWNDPRSDYEADRQRLSDTLKALLASKSLHSSKPKPHAAADSSAQSDEAQPADSPPPQSEAAGDAEGRAKTGDGQTGDVKTAQDSERDSASREGSTASGGESSIAAGRGTADAADRGSSGSAASDAIDGSGRSPWGSILLGIILIGIIAVLIWLIFFRQPVPPSEAAGGGQAAAQQESPADPDGGETGAGSQAAGPGSAASDEEVGGVSGETGDEDAEQPPETGGADDGTDDSSEAADDRDGEVSGESGDSQSGEDRAPTAMGDQGPRRPEDGPAMPFESVWTMAEILRVSNWIAGNNGFALIGQTSDLRRNPDWIFTGNVFTLPNGESYEVRDGDMIWTIADEYLSNEFENSGLSIEEFRENITDLNYNQNGN